MKFFGVTVVAAALVFGACKSGSDTAAQNEAAAAKAAGGDTTAKTGAATATGSMKPITGETKTIKMIGDEKGFRFDPAEVTIKQGDGLKFVMVTGGPHNVAFDATNLVPAAKSQLMANMAEQVSELSGKYLTAPNEEYIVSFAGVPAGTYDFNCTPHLAMNMRGKVTVQ